MEDIGFTAPTDPVPALEPRQYILKFCHNCGQGLDQEAPFPRDCGGCGIKHYRPIWPIVVALIATAQGFVIMKRRSGECVGEWALVGGYQEHGEKWRVGLSREAFEELRVKLDPSRFRLHMVETAVTGDNIIFAVIDADEDVLEQLRNFEPTAEASEIAFTNDPNYPLCFSTHRVALRLALVQRASR